MRALHYNLRAIPPEMLRVWPQTASKRASISRNGGEANANQDALRNQLFRPVLTSTYLVLQYKSNILQNYPKTG